MKTSTEGLNRSAVLHDLLKKENPEAAKND